MQVYGLKTRTDAFGNLYGTSEPAGDGRVMLGTHLDTVYQGGNYDGVVGFIVAVEAVRLAMAERWLRHPIDIVIFRAEESTRFERSCLGSRAAFGQLPAADLLTLHNKHGADKTTLFEALRHNGFNPELIGKPLVHPSHYVAYFETHIEQARVLDGSERLGVVTSIRAPERRRFTVEQRSTSPGAVMKATARMVTAIEWIGELFDGLERDIVATVGKVGDGENLFKGARAPNTVPGEITFPVTKWTAQDNEIALAIVRARQLGPIQLKTEADARLTVTVTGRADHSGGTPMGRLLRRDALAGACEIIQSLPNERFPTVGTIDFVLDLRSRSKDTRSQVSKHIINTMELIASGFDVGLKVSEPTEQGEPIESLDPVLQQLIRDAATECGIATAELPSGAGHDAMIAAQAGIPTAMIFLPSVDGLSHNPNEHTHHRFINHAIEVQATMLRRLGDKAMRD
jgi:acetylornithine deacetylase/succinyl-diaminopimelate desuccinylase-like protein